MPPVRRMIYLSSRTADISPSNNAAHLIFTLRNAVYCGPEERMYVRYDSCTIPNSFQSVDSTSDKLVVAITGGSTYTATIASGNYTATGFAAVVNAALTAAGATMITATYSTATTRMTFANSDVNTATITGSAGRVVGLGFGVPFTVPGSGSSEGRSVVDFAGNKVFYITSPTFDTLGLDSRSQENPGSASAGSILAAVPLDVPYGAVQHHENGSTTKFPVSLNSLNQVEIKLVTPDFHMLEEMADDWSLVLEVQVV